MRQCQKSGATSLFSIVALFLGAAKEFRIFKLSSLVWSDGNDCTSFSLISGSSSVIVKLVLYKFYGTNFMVDQVFSCIIEIIPYPEKLVGVVHVHSQLS